MSNEILLIGSIFIYYGVFMLCYYLFGAKGLLIYNCLALILVNPEVLILVNAFGLTMTLGNVCFSSTFLVTDLLCEKYSKKQANMTVLAGFLASIISVLWTQYWLVFTPASGDTVMSHFLVVFNRTPRALLAGVLVYLMVQLLDIKLYYYWWSVTKKIDSDSSKFLWFRNTFSTIIAQFFNSFLFNVIAFYGILSNEDLKNVIISTFIIYAIMAVFGNPFLYIARNIKPKNYLD